MPPNRSIPEIRGLILLACAAGVVACHDEAPVTSELAAEAEVRTTPFPAPTSDGDQRWVVSEGGSLDKKFCGQAVNVAIPVRRYVGNAYVTGAVRMINDLTGIAIANGVVAPEVIVRVAARDVDPLELDIASLNNVGARRARLIGGNRGWSISEFRFPTHVFRFSRSRGALDGEGNAQPPPLERNLFSIRVDRPGAGWCAEIDWISIEVKSLAPMVGFHGIGATPESTFEIGYPIGFADGVAQAFVKRNLPFEWKFQLPKYDRTRDNAARVVQRAKAVATAYGARRVHLMGNSKGGNWIVYAAGWFDWGDVVVQSVSTIGAPLRGSILADMRTLLMRAAVVEQRPELQFEALTSDPLLRRFARADNLLRRAGQGPLPPGLQDIMTTAEIIPQGLAAEARVSNRVKFFHWSADPDENRDGRVGEIEGLPFSLVSGAACVASGDDCPDLTWLYQTLATTRTVTASLRCQNAPGGPRCRWEVQRVPQLATRNDLIVTDRSAAGNGQLVGVLVGNHGTMADGDNYLRVFAKIRASFPVR